MVVNHPRRMRFEFLERVEPDSDVENWATGCIDRNSGTYWWVDVDIKTGIAYGYVSDGDTPWITDDDLPEEP